MWNVIVKSSRIQGRGVFAVRDFEKGEVIMKWDISMILSRKEAENIPERYRKYLVQTKGKFIMAQSPEKYLNHSCNPNSKQKGYSDVALRDIKKGEEITTDYSKDAPPQIKMKCTCGYNKCKKII